MRGGTAKLRGRGREEEKSCFCIAMSAKRLQVGSPTREDWRRAPVARKTGGVPQWRARLAACPMRRILWDEKALRVLKRALASTAEAGASARTEMLGASVTARGRGKVLPEAPRKRGAGGMPASGAKRRREGSWTGASLENELLMSALLADVAKRTVDERMKNPTMPKSKRSRWRWSKQKFVVAEVKPMWWTDLDTRAAKLQWVGNALTAISGTTIVVLGRGI